MSTELETPVETTTVETPATLADAMVGTNAIAEASKAALAKLAAAKAETVTAEPEVTTDDEPEVETDDRPRNPDGTFAKKDEAPETTDGAEVEAEPEPEAEPLVVVLEGLSERGEEDIELAVETPEALERLRRLKNDAMRGKDYREKMEEVKTKEAELADIQLAVETNPVGFLLDMVEPSRRVEIAKALLTEHFDELQPVIEAYLESPVDAVKARLAAKEQARELAKQTEAQSTQMRQARAILSATEALVPEGVEHGLAAQFLRDAERDLIDAVRARQQVTPENVSQILAKRLKMYGFAGSEGPRKATAKVAPAKGAALSVEQARAAQEKVKATQMARKAAAAIAPAGRGTVVTKTPLIPKTATIEEASKLYLRKKSGA